MKKFFIATLGALVIFISVSTVHAETNPLNFLNGLCKAVVSVPAHLLYTGPKHIAAETSENGFFGFLGATGDYFGRPGVKVLDEVGHAVTFQDSGKSVEEIGAWNEAIEENTLAHVARNTAATWATGALVFGPHHKHIAGWSALATGVGTAVNR